jgi:hypothetical protein
MPRAAGPFKVLEKINDNAYKLELPPEFGVSPTFNISDLKPYLGEEDGLESRTTPIQEGEDDEDISPLHTMQGPITRACAQQLDLHEQWRGLVRTWRRPRTQGGGARMSTPRRSPSPTRL